MAVSFLAQPAQIYVAHGLIALAMILLLKGFKGRFAALAAGPGSTQSLTGLDIPQAKDAHRIGIYGSLILFPVIMATGLGAFWALSVTICGLLILPRIFVSRVRKQFQESFDNNLPDSLMGIASSLRAGLTIQQAFTVSTKTASPEFALIARGIIQDYTLGMPIDDALARAQGKVKTSAMDISFGALRIGRKLGGPLPQILGRVSSAIRERIKVEGKLRALTAQGRAQGVVICGMPILCLVGMRFGMYDKYQILTATLPGQVILGLAFVMWSLGIFLTWRVMQLEV